MLQTRFGSRAITMTMLVLTGAPGAAFADPGPPPPVAGPLPDKSEDSLFNPTPPAALRGFSTDRPTKSWLPYTVDAGHFQVETDLAVYGSGDQAGARTRDWTMVDPTLKLGLTSTIDLELQTAPHEAIISRAGTSRIASTGWGDTYVRVKANLIGDDGGKLAVALLPYIKAPTARAALGNGAIEGGLVAPVSVAVSHGFTVVFDPEIDWLRYVRSGYHGAADFVINISHPVAKVWTIYAETFASHSFQSGSRSAATLDAAVSCAITPRLQWDMGGNFRITGVVPAAQIYTGVSRNF